MLNEIAAGIVYVILTASSSEKLGDELNRLAQEGYQPVPGTYQVSCSAERAFRKCDHFVILGKLK